MSKHVSIPTPAPNEIDQTSRRIVVDVSAVSGQSFFTGVQRIVREFCEFHEEEILLVKWDPKYKVFRVLPRLSRLRYRVTTGFLGNLRVRLKSFYWSASRDFREQGSRRRWMPVWIRNIARSFYDTWLSDTVIEKEGAFHRRPIWDPVPQQTFLLLDIPVSRPHIEGLLTLMEAHEVRTVVYLHDLFPLTHRELFDKNFYQGVRAKHMRYLDVVTSADDVVCNSEFTLSQYERFTKMFETELSQQRRVVYPPWPQFKERTDGSSEDVDGLFDGAQVRILAVGALDKRKNFIVLLRAMELLVHQGVDAHLAIVAGATAQIDPDLNATLMALDPMVLARISRIRQVSDDKLKQVYDMASVIAVPSLAEGFGLPVVEALEKQRPVVASKATALVELARNMPVTLVDAHDERAWAEALVAVSNKGLSHAVKRPKQIPADWADFAARVLGTAKSSK